MTEPERHFQKTVSLISRLLLIWAAASYGCALVVNWLNRVQILTGFPLGYYMGAQGALIVFVLLIFTYARRMDRIDQEFGVED